jgi:DNA-binding NtrC family response regulator
MATERTILSLNPDRKSLLGYESALQAAGFKVISVQSPIEARFEIEMGRCGVFLSSYLTPDVIYRDLATRFRQSCPDGLIAYVSDQPDENIDDSDIQLSLQDEPNSIVERLR